MTIKGCLVLYNPQNDVLSNINTYIDSLTELYVFDNSLQPNQQLIKNIQNIEKVKYYTQGINLGIAAALNYCIDKCMNSDTDWILTMDQDSFFKNSEIEEIIDFAYNQNSKIALVCPFHQTYQNETYVNEIEYPLTVMTSGNLIRTDWIKKIGTFETKLFIDYVDHEFCLRIHTFGGKIIQYCKITAQLRRHKYCKNFIKNGILY